MSFIILVLFVTHLVVPTAFLFSLWRGSYKTGIDWLLTLLTAGAYIIFI